MPVKDMVSDIEAQHTIWLQLVAIKNKDKITHSQKTSAYDQFEMMPLCFAGQLYHINGVLKITRINPAGFNLQYRLYR